MLKAKYKLLFILVITFNTLIYSQNIELNANQWIDDIDFLIESTEQIFPSFKSRKEAKKFIASLQELKVNIDSSSVNQIVFGMQRALNFLGDEGCNIIPFQEKLNTQILPVMMYPFDDGWFICDAKNKTLVGSHVIKINGYEINELYKILNPYLNADNEYYKKRLFSAYSLIPSLLKVNNIGSSNSEIKLEFASGKSILIKAENLSSYSKLNRRLPNEGYFKYSNLSYRDKNYWYEYIPNTKTIFIQLKKIINNKKGYSFSNFVNKIDEEINKNNADKIILDLRYGGGGNGFKLKSFTDLLRDSKNINKKGGLFILTSRATKGTLVELTSILSLNTKALIIGESTAEGPNTVGDTKIIQLPHSKLKISLTKIFWTTSWSLEKSSFLSPDEKVTFSYSDKLKNIDPWLKVVDNYKISEYQKPIPDKIQSELIGTYKINGKKVIIKNKKGSLFLIMNRRMKSFFEIHTELYFKSDGVLATDIKDVFLQFTPELSKKVKLKTLMWKGDNLRVE